MAQFIRRMPAPGPQSSHRSGKALVLMAISLPMLFGVLGLVIDGGMLMKEHRGLQTVADAAATTAAREISKNKSTAEVTLAVETLVEQHNGLANSTVVVNHPPVSGPFAGNTKFVEVILSHVIDSYFIHIINGEKSRTVRTRAVAGIKDATAECALMVLDPDPSPVVIDGLPPGLSPITLPALHLGGLEVLGLGTLRVNGAVVVNTLWGGEDENGDPVGEEPSLGGLRHASTCTPLLPLTKVAAEDFRVSGGVGDRRNYGHVDPAESSPLEANKMPAADPYQDLPVPTVTSDPLNVSTNEYGHVSVVSLPLLSPPVNLKPGVYDSIHIAAGQVNFDPGIYIIRGKHPVSGISLSVIGGQVTANGVLFYITDSAGYSPDNGLPDSMDAETVPPKPSVTSLVPSVVINAGLLGSTYSGLNSSGSQFDGMLLYQRRTDRRPIVLACEQLLGGTGLSGSVYAKWGQLLFIGHGTYDLKFAVGTARIVNTLSCTLAPTNRFPPVQDIFLVE